MSSSRVRHEELEPGVLRLSLDAGGGNVLDRELLGELRREVASRVASRHRAVILDHEGEHFSYGASIPEHAADSVGALLSEMHGLAAELLELDLPIVAAVRGYCLGGGLELALLADRIVASPTARFGQPEIELGVFAPIGSALLPRIVGPRAAFDLLVSGRHCGPGEALERGLIAAVTDDPSAAALEWVRASLGSKSPQALRFATRAARPWVPGFLARLEELERLYLDELRETHDAEEGVAAFLEKRTPRWEGD